MEISETGAIFVLIIAAIISLIVLIKYFRLCNDVRAIRESLEDREVRTPDAEPVVKKLSTGTKSPTKADVREFQDRVREHMKANKGIDSQWLENLIASYNAEFNEDFHQYLKKPQE